MQYIEVMTMRLNSEYALASAVRAARKEAGLSQQQLADLAGMSRVWVARLEGGEANVTLDSLLRVASVLGMSLEATWNPADATRNNLPKKRPPTPPSKPRRSVARKVTTPPKVSATATKAMNTVPASAPAVSLDDVLSRVTKK